MDTSLIISATNSGKKVTKAITNINPEKDNAVLKTFAQKVNALTTNTYVDATRVNKMSVEEADPQGGSSKTEGVISIENGYINYNGDGILYRVSNGNTDTVQNGDLVGVAPITRYFFANATDNYTAAVLVRNPG